MFRSILRFAPGAASKRLVVACPDGNPIIGDFTLVMLTSNMMSAAAEAGRDDLIGARSKSSQGGYANYVARTIVLVS